VAPGRSLTSPATPEVALEKALVGTPPETGGAARAAALVVLAGIALLLGAALFSPAAQARPLTVCCFRVTVEVSGEAQATYTRVDKTDSQGDYDYTWGPTGSRTSKARPFGQIEGWGRATYWKRTG
jgi:hypothetical protein